MISATCCRCGCELSTKGGIVLTAPVRSSPETIVFDGLEGDIVVKRHVCVSCMEALSEWLKVGAQPKPIRCVCGTDLVGCIQCGVAGGPTGRVECPVAARKAGRYPIATYHVCSIHHGHPIGTEPRLIAHALFEGRALCGFMAGTVPTDWPSWHYWVSIDEIKEKPPLLGACQPCDRCLNIAHLAPASALNRTRA